MRSQGSRARRWALGLTCGLLAVAGSVACSDDSGDFDTGRDTDGDGDGDGAGEGSDGENAAEGEASPSTTLEDGGIEITAPNGWREVPLPTLGFGLALPEEWEALVLSEQGLKTVAQADPAVPGFSDAAHATAAAGGVFYAAGVEASDRVTDLKVRAAPGAGVTTAAALYNYARTLATEAGLVEPSIRTLTDAARPTVMVRYSTDIERADPDDPDAEPTPVTVEGSELLVVAPNGVVYSFIVTSENPDGHDAFAERVFDTLAFSATPPPEADAETAPAETP